MSPGTSVEGTPYTPTPSTVHRKGGEGSTRCLLREHLFDLEGGRHRCLHRPTTRVHPGSDSGRDGPTGRRLVYRGLSSQVYRVVVGRWTTEDGGFYSFPTGRGQWPCTG